MEKTVMIFISFGIFFYVWFSLIGVLPIKLRWKLIWGLPLLVISQRFTIMYFWGGSVFFAPEISRWMLLVLAYCHALTILLLFAVALKDIIWLFWSIIHRFISPNIAPFPRKKASFIIIGFSIIFTSWGLYSGTSVPEVRKITITLPSLPSQFNNTTIAVLADLHFSAINTLEYAQAIVARTNALNPDIVAIPGDMFDGDLIHRESSIRELGKLESKFGVFVVPGNHEYFFGYTEWANLLKSMPNIELLENRNMILKSGNAQIVISGLTDDVATRYNLPAPDARASQNGLEQKQITQIMLVHRPIFVKEASENSVDLVLSGHTHGGMIWFLKPFIASFNGGRVAGLYHLKNTALYISNGSGIWNGFPIRIGVPPEITLITLESGRE